MAYSLDASIIDDSDFVIAVPQGLEIRRSGTWATVRYARKTGVPVFILWPDGLFERDGGS